jgi:hypothetical protein
MIKLADLLKEATTKLNYKEHLSPRDIHELSSLIFTKKDVMASADSDLKSLNMALKFYSEGAPQLYRGLYPKEVIAIGNPEPGKSFSLNKYGSFSENIEIAEEFADKTKEKTLIYLDPGAIGFCYHKFYMWYLNRLDDLEYDLTKGDDMKAVIQREKEWILAKKTKFQIKKFEVKDNRKIIECSFI